MNFDSKLDSKQQPSLDSDLSSDSSLRAISGLIPVAKLTSDKSFKAEDLASIMKNGSKSFSFASAFFPKPIRMAVYSLYAWCRYCDDVIDGSELGFHKEHQDLTSTQSQKLNLLIQQTQECYQSETPLPNPSFEAFRKTIREYSIPSFYPQELLQGMAMDTRGDQYETFEDLLLYCYRVAGTVGLMMCHIMGVSDEKALRHAAHLGIAMQLTNISRDVQEDLKMGRRYLPLEWLREEGGRVRATARLVHEADHFYNSALAGLRYLPLRSALTIAIAAKIYSQIGAIVVKRGSRAWNQRVVVPAWRKLWAVCEAAWVIARILPKRLLTTWKPIPIQTIWRLP